MGGAQGRGPLAAELSRRDFIARACTLGAGAYVIAALPAARLVRAALPSLAAPADATLQAFADTLVPGRRASPTRSTRAPSRASTRSRARWRLMRCASTTTR